MDLSFLPKVPRGPLGLSAKDAALGAGASPVPIKKESSGHIFMSFSQRDSQAVELLVRKLHAAGHAVWSARGPNQGERELQEQVVSGISEARLFLLFLSPESAASEQVERELELAAANAKPIVAVLLRRTTIPQNMNYTLVGAPRIDLSENFDTGVARLLETAAAGTGKAPSPAGSGEPLPPASLLERFTSFFGFKGRRARLLMAHGTPLLTDYKHVHISIKTIEATENDPGGIIVEGHILTQWRHPVSHELYLFSTKVSPDAGDSIKTRTITVYVDPQDMSRYHMDTSFLPENRWQTKRKKQKEQPAANVAPSAQTAEARGIFVSYSERDAGKATLLMQELQSQGREILNRPLAPGTQADREAVQKAIESASVFLLLVPSQDANDLDDKTKELRVALGSHARIVPVSFGDSPTPLCMQLALSGIQRIVLSPDPQAGIQPLLPALASPQAQPAPAQSSPAASSRPASKRFVDKLRERLTGALLGWLSWAVGSALPALLSAHSRAASVGVGIAAFVPGGMWGAIVYKRKVSIRVFAPVVAISGFVVFIVAYMVFIFLLSLPPASNERMLLGALLGIGTFLLGWMLEMRWFDTRLKKNGRLLLTEYKGVRLNTSESHDNNRHYVQVVSEWRDPVTDQVYEFLSRDFANDPSERIRSSTIAVFVNPNNFQDYYMDLSSAKARKASGAI